MRASKKDDFREIRVIRGCFFLPLQCPLANELISNSLACIERPCLPVFLRTARLDFLFTNGNAVWHCTSFKEHSYDAAYLFGFHEHRHYRHTRGSTGRIKACTGACTKPSSARRVRAFLLLGVYAARPGGRNQMDVSSEDGRAVMRTAPKSRPHVGKFKNFTKITKSCVFVSRIT